MNEQDLLPFHLGVYIKAYCMVSKIAKWNRKVYRGGNKENERNKSFL